MAKIKLGNMITEIRGSVNGNTYSKGAYGAYIRTKVTPRNPRSIAQTAVRALFAFLSSLWRDLETGDRTSWNLAAPLWSRLNIFGDNLPLTGFNLFKRLNGNLQAIGRTVITAAPAIVATPESVIEIASLSVSEMTLNANPAIPHAYDLQIFATQSLSPGKNYVSSELRQIGVITGAAFVDGVDIMGLYVSKFGAAPVLGQKVFLEFYFVNVTTGQASQAQRLSWIVSA